MKNNNRGFTLAELLIVVAIIAVLVAIAIPIFTSQLEKAREATDAANIRDWYAEVTTALVTGDLDPAKTTQTLKVAGGFEAKVSSALTGDNGTYTVTVSGIKTNQTVANWQNGALVIGGFPMPATTNMVGATKVDYTFTVTAGSDTAASSTYLSNIGF